MSLRQPATEPPTGAFGETLDRYSRFVEVECPACGSVGLDVWINGGATEYRAVCVENGCEVEEVESR